jgi:glutamine synthetase
MGVSALPKLPRDAGDRNRTSPFAFTGNKFEFRAPGSSQSVARPNTVLNTIVAEAVDAMTGALEERIKSTATLEEAVLAVVKETYAANARVVFGGDNYSGEWHAEAERRGLPNLPQTPDALPAIMADETVQAFEAYNVLTRRELQARYEVFVEQYVSKINIEGETAASIARTMLVPAAVRYLGELAQAGDGSGVSTLRSEVSGLLDDMVERLLELERANLEHPAEQNVLSHAHYVQKSVLPAMESLREVADRLERVVPDALWPLPKYSEILFIK